VGVRPFPYRFHHFLIHASLRDKVVDINPVKLAALAPQAALALIV